MLQQHAVVLVHCGIFRSSCRRQERLQLIAAHVSGPDSQANAPMFLVEHTIAVTWPVVVCWLADASPIASTVSQCDRVSALRSAVYWEDCQGRGRPLRCFLIVDVWGLPDAVCFGMSCNNFEPCAVHSITYTYFG